MLVGIDITIPRNINLVRTPDLSRVLIKHDSELIVEEFDSSHTNFNALSSVERLIFCLFIKAIPYCRNKCLHFDC